MILLGFTALFAVCFDEPGARTLYARHVLWHNIKARDTGNDRPSFKTDGYYDFDVNEAYTQAQQSITIEALTGIDSYVDTSSDVYLARGHYSPNSDFVYYSGQVQSLCKGNNDFATKVLLISGRYLLLRERRPPMAVLQRRQLA